MPVEYFDFYTFVEPYVDGYFKVGETEKARELYRKLKDIYMSRLNYYAGIPLDEQYEQAEQILTDLEAYKRIIDILILNDDREMAESETLIFNEQLDRIALTRQSFMDELPELPEAGTPDPDLIDTLPVSDTIEGSSDSTQKDSALPANPEN